MITKSERETLNELGLHTDDFAIMVCTTMLSRYDRIRKEAAQLNQILGPNDVESLATEAIRDVRDWFELDEE